MVIDVKLEEPCLSFSDVVHAVRRIGALPEIILSEGWQSGNDTPYIGSEPQQLLVERLLSALQPLVR